MFEFLKKDHGSITPIHSHPLIYPEKKLALFFSAKAGCTFATKWFFYQQGILEEALEYNPFVHAYRRHIYVKRPEYKKELRRVVDNDYTRIKLVRSPYHRAVSSFIHAITSNHVTEEISDFLGRPLSENSQFSFEEFIAFLEKTGVQYCNPHHRVQALPDEQQNTLTFNTIIKLENSADGFREVESQLGLMRSDIEDLAQSFHHRNKMPSNTFNGDRIFGKKDRQFYEYRTFYNDNLRDRVARLYACDFSQYRYDVNEI